MPKLTPAAAPPVTPKERQYRDLFAECERRGLSLTRLAEEKGIPVGTVGWWRKEIRRREALRAGEAPSCGRRRRTSAMPSFAPVRVVDGVVSTGRGEVIEVVLPSGPTLRIPPSFEPESLRCLLAVLDAGC